MTLFKIVGSSDTKLSLRLEHPIHLDPDKDYSIGLVGFYGKNSIQNIPKRIHYVLHLKDPKKGKYGDWGAFHIESGYYSIEKIEEVIMKTIKLRYPRVIKPGEEGRYFLRAEPITQKIEFKLPVDIHLFPDFTDDSINLGHLLGFRRRQEVYFPHNQTHLAESPPRMSPYRVIEIHCNIVKPSITNHDTDSHSHQETDILYMFHTNLQQSVFGSIIAEKPTQVDYVPVNKNVRSLQNIELEIKNEENKELNFLNENLIVYLKLVDNGRSS